ncbi:MAG: hypothetical protein KDA96_02325 [Planctomycetaceae bacterium]|nr:hypothetical protein [Planctomycetaceae bacterium]
MILSDDRAVISVDESDGSVVQQTTPSIGTTNPSTPISSSTDDPEFAKKKEQILKSLVFDRRPSTILNTWANPPKPDAPADDSKEASGAGSTQAATPEKGKDEPAPDEGTLTEEQKQARAAEEEARRKAEEAAAEAKRKAEELAAKTKAFESDIESLKRSVTLSQWTTTAETLKRFSTEDQKTIFSTLLRSLVAGPPDSPRSRSGEIIGEKNLIRGEDLVAIAELSPSERIADGDVAMLSQLINACSGEGQAHLSVLDAIRTHLRTEVPARRLTDRIVARLLFASGHAEDTLEFLPSLNDAVEQRDTEALDLLGDAYQRLFLKDSDTKLLEDAWTAVQAILEGSEVWRPKATAPNGNAGETEKVTAADQPTGAEESTAVDEETKKREQATEDARVQKALRTAVSLVPRLREELGQKWLADSFTADPARGQRILNGIGGTAARGMFEQLMDADTRVRTLKLQQTAVEALLREAPEQAKEWSSVLHLMAVNWLREAVYSSQFDTTSSRGPVMQRDEFGNLFWTSESSGSLAGRNGNPSAAASGQLLDVRPTTEWLAFVDPTYLPTFDVTTARLHLKVKEDEKAFPYIESLAATHPTEARELVQEFLRLWSDNHDPNTSNRRTSIYMYSFGYSTRASGIPLTRSHQQRNLTELAEWVQRIRALPIEDIDEQWISSAFVRVHSAAEVYRLEDMEAVFGSVGTLKPATLAALLETMRNNLNSVWRAPQIQQNNKTNRRKQDIEAEVKGGYRSAFELCEQGLKDSPDNWELLLVKGALLHDENNYLSDLEPTSDFTERRREAFSVIQHAAKQYGEKTTSLKESQFSVQPFNTWFYAALGDCSLGNLSPERRPDSTQLDQIRQTMESLPSQSREKHMDMFANDLFTRMSSVNPGVKFRYVTEGLKIAGDRRQGEEARKLFDYYSDLVTEIRLAARIDGAPQVGHETPFGLYVSIEHTKAIERESGGFGRYLQNQNSGGGYYYNNGRPNEDYRDKFESAAREALNEHFEVISVTFEPESINSRAGDEPEWRETPYAYLLLRARGPEIDRVPPLRLDLDFLDTTGYVVLPVESDAISVDSTPAQGKARPFELQQITQTLDERQAKDGRLVVEIKAVGQGLIPELNSLIDPAVDGFEVSSVEDSGIAVSRFDPDSSDPVIISERTWMLNLVADGSAPEKKLSFTFPTVLLPAQETVFQRYNDADLAVVEQTLALQQVYEKPQDRTTTLIFAALATTGVVIFAVFGWRVLRRTSAVKMEAEGLDVPTQLTPFTVLSYLKQIERNNGLPARAVEELTASIDQVERYYFAEQRGEAAPDLADLVHHWHRKAR